MLCSAPSVSQSWGTGGYKTHTNQTAHPYWLLRWCPNFTSTYRGVNARLALCLNSVLNVKAVVAAFNQEKALVAAFSVIVQLHRLIVYTSRPAVSCVCSDRFCGETPPVSISWQVPPCDTWHVTRHTAWHRYLHTLPTLPSLKLKSKWTNYWF